MTTETVLTDAEIITIGQQARAIEAGENGYILPVTFARAIQEAVLQSPEVQALRKDAKRMRRNTLLAVLGKLNSNPYSLTKSECIDVVREMFEEADAAMEKQQ